MKVSLATSRASSAAIPAIAAPSTPREPVVQIHINALTLLGVALNQRDASALQSSFVSELTRLVGGNPTLLKQLQAEALPSVPVRPPVLNLPPGASPRIWGRAIARPVYQRLCGSDSLTTAAKHLK